MQQYDRRKDRRNGPDIWTKSISWFAVGGWLIMFIALLIFSMAKPHAITFFKQKFNINFADVGFDNLSTILFIFMIIGLILSAIGFYVNSKRSRRKNDEYHLSLVLLGMISIIGIISYFLTL